MLTLTRRIDSPAARRASRIMWIGMNSSSPLLRQTVGRAESCECEGINKGWRSVLSMTVRSMCQFALYVIHDDQTVTHTVRPN